MIDNIIVIGAGRTSISVSWDKMGTDLIVRIYNENAYIGAVALASCPQSRSYATGELLNLVAHAEGSMAVNAAIRIAGAIKNTVCVAGGVHVENVTRGEQETVLANVDCAVEALIERLKASAGES